jgi:hypothetical protein
MGPVSSESPYGKAFAAAYLLALSLLGVAVVLAVVLRTVWPVFVAIAAVAVLVVLANVLGRTDPSLDGARSAGTLSNYQYAWWTLLLGGEVRRSWAVLRGRS